MTPIAKENMKLRLSLLEQMAIFFKNPSPEKIASRLDKESPVIVEYKIRANDNPEEFSLFYDESRKDSFFLDDHGCKLTMIFSQGDRRYAAVKEFERSYDIGAGMSCGKARQYVVDIINELKK